MNEITKQIRLRKTLIEERIPGVIDEIQANFKLHREKFDSKLNEITNSNSSRRSKIFKLQEVMSEVRALSEKFSACRSGCSNCCHQRVMLSQTEADLIGKNIARPAVQLQRDYKMPDVDSYNQLTPCTFLVDGACSIYNSRPLMCRHFVNLDVDNLLCSFENWELGKSKHPDYLEVPTVKSGPILATYQKISAADLYGDIRDFFPAK